MNDGDHFGTEAPDGAAWFADDTGDPRRRIRELEESLAQSEARRARLVSAIEALPDGLVPFDAEERRVVEELARHRQQLEQLVDERTRELSDNRQRFRDFAESSADWFWEMDADLRFTYMSSAVTRILGVSPEWHYGKTREEILGAENIDSAWAAHLQTLRERKPFRDFTYYRIGEGVEPRWLATNGVPVFDEAGTFQGYRGTARDMTAAIEAERTIRESEKRFQDYAEASADWFWEMDADLRFTYMSPAVERILGLAPEWHYGKSREDILGRERHSGDWPGHLRILREQKPFRDFTYYWIGEGAAPRWISVSGVPLFGEDGAFIGYRGSGRDVTAEIEAEVATRESRDQLRMITDNLPISIVYVDKERNYRFVNQVARRWHLRQTTEFIGKSIDEIMQPNAKAVFGPRIERALAGETVRYQDQLTYPDGVDRVIDATYLPDFDDADAVRGFYGLVLDVTEQRAAEEQLQQAQKMEAVGQLTGGIAHDFNNLLTVILGNVELLEERLAGGGREQRLLSSAKDAALRGADLTQRLLAFSRKQSLSPKPTNVNSLIVGMGDMLRRTLGEQVDLVVTAGEQTKSALVDSAQLENALLNLAINARDAMPDGGTLRMESANMEIVETADQHEGLAPGGYVAITVSDSGVGMIRTVQDRVFEPFFTTKPVGKGSGLGLSMVYGFAKQSGGHVKLYSEQGIGTTVKLFLPWADSTRAAKWPAEDGGGTEPGSEKILVVEDDPDVQAYVINLLQGLGYQVLGATDGAEAVGLLSRTDPPIDLLFTDVVLPGGMSGRDVATAVAARWPSTKVLFTSGYSGDIISQQGRLDKDVELLVKPYTRDALSRRIRAMLVEPAD